MTRRVLIYGASGFTGALSARALLGMNMHGDKGSGFTLVLSGRDPARLRALAEELGEPVEIRPAVVHDPASLRAAMEGVSVVVNCAGPFLQVGEPVVASAIECGAHYLDTASEQAFLRLVYERYESAARRAGVVVVNGMAFEVALGDLCAYLTARALGPLGPGEPADDIAVAYALTRFRSTLGTRMSAIANLSASAAEWSLDRWEPVLPGAERRRFHFGPEVGDRDTLSFPSGEVITVPRHTPAARVQTYLSLADAGPLGEFVTRLTSAMGRVVMPALLRSPALAYARARLAAGPAAPSADDRAYSQFAVAVYARREFAEERMFVHGRDPYGLSATIVALAAAALLDRGTAHGGETSEHAGAALIPGVRAPAEVFAPQAMLDQIAERAGLSISASFPLAQGAPEPEQTT